MNIKDITDKNPDIRDIGEIKFLIEHNVPFSMFQLSFKKIKDVTLKINILLLLIDAKEKGSRDYRSYTDDYKILDQKMLDILSVNPSHIPVVLKWVLPQYFNGSVPLRLVVNLYDMIPNSENIISKDRFDIFHFVASLERYNTKLCKFLCHVLSSSNATQLPRVKDFVLSVPGLWDHNVYRIILEKYT